VLEDAVSLHEQGRLAEAAALYRKMLADNPGNADALHLLGVVELQSNNPSAAAELIGRAIGINPRSAIYFSNLGLAFRALGRFDEALACYARALAIRPDYADALNHRGNVLRDLKRFPDALASYARALAVRPDFADALNNHGAALSDLKRFDEALASYDRALALRPDYAEALNNRGAVLSELKRFDEALASYDRALAVQPDHAEVLNNRGNVLSELKRFEDALVSYDRALAILPDYFEAWYNRGAALSELKRFDEALASHDRALSLRPDSADALNNRGNALRDLKRFDDSLASYDAALTVRPDFAEALYNRGNALSGLKRFDEALASYDRALAIRPDYAFLPGWRLFCRMAICDWRGIADDFSRLAEAIESGESASSPSVVLATPLSAAQQKQCAEIFIRANHPPNPLLGKFPGSYKHDRIRLGYFSADFHNHATAYLMAELFERHDQARFELNAFAFGPPNNDAMRTRLKRSFDRFIEIGAVSDQDAALLARSLEIDIAIDLKGFTEGSRTEIFAMGAAPIQVNYLGYPGTMGAGYIDYLIADPTLIPPEQRRHYAEKIVYLPDCYQVNDAKRMIAGKNFTRNECGLPEKGFVFCCFNNSYKIAPALFDIWMRLLNEVEGSVLWLLEDNASATKNLRAEAQSRGVAPERLVFAKRIDLPRHLARHRAADLFLDTLPYNAHTTASDALWAGLPVLTCLGETFAGRVAASLLHAIGLPELISRDLGAYEARALELAANPEKLQLLRERLSENRLTQALFDTARFTRHIESAYAAMWERHRAGFPPEHIHVER
jgi:predicted O-linked N-acetylglucosamine transferase (SPINDLY family)